jgi:hypothetical protein
MNRTANFKAVWRLNHVETANTNMFTRKFRSNDVNIHDNLSFVKWTPRKWSVNLKCRMCLLGEYNGAFLKVSVIFMIFLCSLRRESRSGKGAINYSANQGSVNIKGHIIIFALVQASLCACSVYRLLTEILRVRSCSNPSIRSHAPAISLSYKDWQRRAGFRFYPYSTCLWRELTPGSALTNAITVHVVLHNPYSSSNIITMIKYVMTCSNL